MKCHFSNSIQLSKDHLERYESYAGRNLYTAAGIIQIRKQIQQDFGQRIHNAFKTMAKIVKDIWNGFKKALFYLSERGERVVKAEKSLVLRTKRFQQIRKMSPRHSQVIDRRPFRIVARSTC